MSVWLRSVRKVLRTKFRSANTASSAIRSSSASLRSDVSALTAPSDGGRDEDEGGVFDCVCDC